jgi:hypothetical protein
MKKFLPLILLPLLLSACKKADTLAPAITLIAPSDNQVLSAGTSYTVRAQISDNSSIHMVHLMVMDEVSFEHLVLFEEHIDSKHYDLNKSFTPVSGHGYLIHIEAEDHDENSSSKDLTVTTN